MPDSGVPVTILTGFLGSGKTTLLNHILTATHGKKIAIIENEFGETAIDDKLIAQNSKFRSDEEIIEVLNGCICCSVRKDLVDVLHKLASRTLAGEISLDAIVIETTGLADPAPVAQTFLVYDEIKAFARLDGIVTMVDAKHTERHLDVIKPEGIVNEAVAQAAFADRLLLNKADLVTGEDLERIEARLRGINPFAPIQRCTHGTVSVDWVLDIRGFDLQRALQVNPQLLDKDAAPTQHDGSVTSVSLDQGAPRHLRTVRSGDLDLELAQDFLEYLMDEAGEDIYRMKGVLSVAHAHQKFVYHAVHMTFSGAFEEAWAEGEARESKMVFIGLDLDEEFLAGMFNKCLATPENLRRKASALRFAIGAAVECRAVVGPRSLGGAWSAGTVVGHLVRDDDTPQGLVAPYEVQLEDGRVILVRKDCDSVIRSMGADEEGGKVDEGEDGGNDESDQAQHQEKRLKI